MTEDTTDAGAVDQRVDGLEQALSRQLDTIRDRLGEIEREVEQENEELRARVEDLEAENYELKAKIRALDPSTNDGMSKRKRCEIALRRALWNRAQSNDGKAQMQLGDVRNALIDQGIDSIYDPQCYTAMENAAKTDGFEYTTDQSGSKVVRVDIEDTPTGADVGPIRVGADMAGVSDNGGSKEISRAGDGSPVRSEQNHGGEHNQG